MEYFYAPPRLITPPTLIIDGDEFSHMTHVMRLREGDTARVVDGAGTAYDTVIERVERHTARCRITAHHSQLHEPSRAVTLAVGILKNPSRFDFLVEKAVELGVAAIVPLLTQRTIARHAKVERWQKISLAAMKQSGRCFLPLVYPLTDFPTFVSAHHGEAVRLIAHEKSDGAPSGSTMAERRAVVVCIGPEGGFSEEEIARAGAEGFHEISLGTRRLRTETAAVVSLALILRPEGSP